MTKESIFSVKDKIIIITGGSEGNGAEITKGFLEEGSNVIVLDKKEIKPKKYFSNPNFHFYKVDITNRKILKSIISKIISEFKTIDVLINNAGISLKSNKNNYLEVWNKTLDVNLHSPFFLISLVQNNMKPGSSIINITSLGAYQGFKENPSYIASKSGLSSLTKSFAFDLSKKGIRVNNIVPGYIKTNMTKKSFISKVQNKKRKERMILQRWGESKDLVGPCIFLASSASSYMTGSDIIVDGGWLSKGI